MYSLFISFVIYVFAAWYFNKLISNLYEPGFTKKLVVFILASVLSYLSANLIDWIFPSQALTSFSKSKSNHVSEQQQMQSLLQQL